MRIVIGADHAGAAIKARLVSYLTKKGYSVIDVGGDGSDASDDYVDYAIEVAHRVVDGRAKGVLICGSGIGMSIAANKIAGARAALVTDMTTAKVSRSHNDANIIALPARGSSYEQLRDRLRVWLQTPFSRATRHTRRLKKIMALDHDNSGGGR